MSIGIICIVYQLFHELDISSRCSNQSCTVSHSNWLYQQVHVTLPQSPNVDEGHERSPPVTVIFAEDDDFTSMFVEDFLPNLPVRRMPVPTASYQSTAAVRAPSSAIPRPTATAAGPPRQNSEVIELLDDDD